MLQGFKKISLVFLLCLLTENSFAQLRIVRDNIACAYGLKNKANDWVIEPTYILIENLSPKFFTCLNHKGYGVIDQNGNKILENQYSKITTYGDSLFLVEKEGLWGLIGFFDKIILPLKYKYTTNFKNFHKDKKNNAQLFYRSITQTDVYSLLVNFKGEIIIPEQKGYIQNIPNTDLFYISDSNLNPYYENNHIGVIDLDNKIVFPREYKRLMFCENNYYYFQKDSSSGFMNLNGEILFETKYLLSRLPKINYSDFDNLLCFLHDNIYMITSKDKKNGVIKSNGEILIEPSFDLISPIQASSNYLVTKNNKQGWMDRNGKIIHKPIYDNIYQIQNDYFLVEKDGKKAWIDRTGEFIVDLIYDTLVPLGNKSRFGLCKINGKYGVVSNRNKIIIEPDYDYFLSKKNKRLEFQNDIFFQKKNNIYIFKFSDTIKISQLKLKTKTKDFALFEFDSKYYFFKLIDGKYQFLEDVSVRVIQNTIYYQVQSEDYCKLFNFKGKELGVFYPLNLELEYNYLIQYGQLNKNQLFMTDTCRNNVIVDLQKAKIRLKKDCSNMDLTDFHKNRIWLSILTEDSLNTFYQVMDTNGRLLSKLKFNQPIIDHNENCFASTINNDLQGLIDTNFNWVIKPTFKEVDYLTAKYITIVTQSGKVGVINLNGKIILDTIYKNFQVVFRGYEWRDTIDYSNIDVNNRAFHEYISKSREVDVLFYNDSEQIIFNNLTEIISDKKEIDNKLIELAFKGKSNTAYNVIGIYSNTIDIDEYKYKKELYNFFSDKKAKETYYNILKCAASYIVLKPEKRYLEQEIEMNYLNLIFKDSMFQKVNLENIFPNKENFQKELFQTIQEDETFDRMACSDSETLLSQFSTHFELNSKGIYLYYVPTKLKDYNPKVLITKEQLKKYPESKWILEYLK